MLKSSSDHLVIDSNIGPNIDHRQPGFATIPAAAPKSKRLPNGRRARALAGETGLEIGEFRKIVHMVQKGEREARQAKKEMLKANLRLVISISPRSTPIAACSSST
jgi:DNA-directed RNA polymerase sigma subunit (sigma70/sigma32)